MKIADGFSTSKKLCLKKQNKEILNENFKIIQSYNSNFVKLFIMYFCL